MPTRQRYTTGGVRARRTLIALVAVLAGILMIAAGCGGDSDDEDTNGDTEETTDTTFTSDVTPLGNAVFSGETEQGQRIVFRTEEDGKTIRDLNVPLRGDCSDGGPFTTTYRQGDTPFEVKPGGIVTGSDSVTGVKGEIVGGIFRLDGRVEEMGRVIRGTVSEHAEIRDGGTCDATDIEFEARAEGGG